jgi:hypothetical protein
MSCGAEEEANELMVSILAGKTFELPEVDLSGSEFQVPAAEEIALPEPLTNASLTTAEVNGSGTLDIVLKSLAAHLKAEFEAARITGAEYTKAYTALIDAALGNSVQFLLGKDTAYWQSVTAQAQAQTAKIALVTARVGLETAKAQLASARFEALNQEAAYALVKLKLATESVGYCTAKFNLEQMAPVQKLMLLEQYEGARAQTADTRSNGQPILGLMGKQKDLYNQQIISYQRDAEVKAAKLFTDAWITMKTMDEGLLPPTKFNNASLDEILAVLKINNAIGT